MATDLPYWVKSRITKDASQTNPHSSLPYTLTAMDMKFSSAYGFNHGEIFSTVFEQRTLIACTKKAPPHRK